MPAKKASKQNKPSRAPRSAAAAKPQRPAPARATRPAPSTTVSPRPDAGAARAGKAGVTTTGGAQAARAQRWALVTARDLMRKDLATVREDAPLSEVERVLADHRVLGLPVVNRAGGIVGVVSVTDLVARYAEDPDARPRREPDWFRVSSEELGEEDLEAFEVPEAAEETARDIMTAQIFKVPATAGLQEIAAAMCAHKVHRVLVEAGGKLVGLVSTMDILEGLRE